MFPSLLPACPIRHWTGLLCPGCGGTHCLLALLHGDLRSAWQHNALLTLLLPAAVLLAATHLISTAQGRPSPVPRLLQSRATLWMLSLAAALFTAARNLPG